MKIACPHCTQHIELDTSWYGKLLECPNCRGIIDIPSQTTVDVMASLTTDSPKGIPYAKLLSSVRIAALVILILVPLVWIAQHKTVQLHKSPSNADDLAKRDSQQFSPRPEHNTQEKRPSIDSFPNDICYGIPVPGKPGFVTSPHAPNAGFVDVRGFSAGEEVNDPYTGRIFLVPSAFSVVTPEVEVVGWETSGSESRVRLGNNTDTPLGGPFWLCGYDEHGAECFRQALQGADVIPAGGEIIEPVSLNNDDDKRVKLWRVKLQ
ncbi:MAG: hypothetical protein ACKOKC_02035 [Chthoniobacterales bacterium]